jgi:N-acetyl-anhydromuramyl-L-alanine amidase AmpD
MPEFRLGFRALADRFGPDAVGEPVEDEGPIGEPYNAQMATKGFMIFSKQGNQAHFFRGRSTVENAEPWRRVELITAGFRVPRSPRTIRAIVWHDMEGLLADAVARFNTGVAGAHFAICRNGDIVLLCRPENIAFHAGTDGIPGSETFGRTEFWRTHNINPHSVGIELEGFVGDEYTEEQIEACIALGRWLTRTFPIPVEHTFDRIEGHHAHSEISSQREDPGPNFPFERILTTIQQGT